MIICPKCGVENRDDASFCRECGTPLTPAPQPASGPQKSKTPLIVGAVAGVVVLCCICLIAAVLLAKYTDVLSFLPFFGPKWSASKIVPADTGFLTSVNPSVENLAGFKHLSDVYGDIPEIQEALDDFLAEMEAESGITFESDIKPWLGQEVALAIPDLEAAMGGQEPEIVLAVATRDRRDSDAFLEKLRQYLVSDGYVVSEATYNGVTYYVQETKSEWETPALFGTVNDFVILATGASAMENVIDVAQGDAESLAKNETYTRLVDALPEEAVALMFYDMQGMMDALLRDSGVELPPEAAGQLEAFQAMGMSVSLDTEGVQMDFVVTFDPDALSPETRESFGSRASAGRILQRVPSDALAFVSGQDVAAAWRNYLTTLKENPDIEKQLDDLGDSFGLKLDEELFAWATGELAIAVVESGGATSPVGGFAVFEVDAQQEAEETMSGLATFLADMLYLEFEESEIGGVAMRVIRDSYTEEIMMGYGFTDAHLVIGFMEDALAVAVDDSIAPIVNDAVFKQVQSHLPRDTGGYFYVNVEAAWRLAYDTMSDYDKQDFDAQARPFLEPVKAIGMASSVTDPQEGLGRSTVFIYIP